MKNVLVDKSGIKTPKATGGRAQPKKGLKATVPEPTPDIVKRIRDIHITPDPTIKEFLQPIEPNLRRTPAIQLKQLPYTPLGDQLELERKILQDAKDLSIVLRDLPKDDVNAFRKFVRKFPTVAELRLAKAVLSGDPLDIASAIRVKEIETTRQETKKAASEKKKINDKNKERDAQLKVLADSIKENEQKIVDEKNKPKPAPKPKQTAAPLRSAAPTKTEREDL